MLVQTRNPSALSARVSWSLALLLTCVPAMAATVSDWRADVDQLVADVRSLHPDPFTKTGELEFLRRANAIKESLPSMSEEQRVVAVMRLVALLGDGHSQLEPDKSAFALWYPIRIYEFSDGIFVTAAHTSVADLAGAQLLEIAGFPAAHVVADARSLMGSDNAMDSKERLYAFHNAALMNGLGYAGADGELKVKVRLRSGQVVERTLTPRRTDHPRFKKDDASFAWVFRREMFGPPVGRDEEWVSAYRNLPSSAFLTADSQRPLHLAHAARFFSTSIPARKAYYIQISQVDDLGMGASFRTALEEVERLRPDHLIIDLRYNFGGDGSRVNDAIHELIRRKEAKSWKELYVLTGRKTFSAGVMLVAALKEHLSPTMIGEPPGAPLNSYGDAVSRPYPRSGLRLNISTLRHQLGASNDLSAFLPMDVPATFQFSEYAAGADPALDPLLAGVDMRSIAAIALASGGRAAREVWNERKARFAGTGWWGPPPELDLRAACMALVDQKRIAEALETCSLNADMHPHIWNVWYNLGRTQRAAGLMHERLRSHLRVLEVDPNNFNAESLRRTFREALQPPVIRFGASVADMEKALAGSCSKMTTRKINPPFLDGVKTEQLQIDCDGFSYLGKPRWAEFVIRDGSLEMVWIMTTKEEETFIRDLMIAAYGDPTRQNQKYIAFENARMALRFEPAEVLLYSPALDEQASPWFK